MRATLPAPPPAFARRKARILAQLAVPADEYADASPKGSVDAGIRGLIDALNARDGFVTTSSCAGRVSVFVEGSKVQQQQQRQRPRQGVAQGGGAWLFVSHDPVVLASGAEEDLLEVFGLRGREGQDEGGRDAAGGSREGETESRLVHFKFEPMILHVLTASLEHAQLLLRCGHQAGFRESGAINVTAAAVAAGEEATPTPIVAIRTVGLALESLVGVQRGAGGDVECTVSPAYLRTLLDVSNERFAENAKRIRRFEAALAEAMRPPTKSDGSEWEDAAARRERKRAEGLRRKAELASRNAESKVVAEDQDAEGLDLTQNRDSAP